MEMSMNVLLTWAISLSSIFLSVFWINIFLKNEKQISRTPKPIFPPVSVIIPAHNEESNIRSCIESILGLDYPKNKLEVIVVNDGSTDGTREIAESFGKKIMLINRAKSGGRKAIPVNVGIRAAHGEIVACMDADSVVSRDCLMKMIGKFREPGVVAVTASMKILKPKNLWQKMQSIEYFIAIFLRKMMDMIDTISVTPGPFSLYRRSLFDDIGYFDEDNITEDNEIALRIQHARYKIRNSVDAYVYTDSPDNFRDLYDQRLRWYRGLFRNVRKYDDMILNRKFGNFGTFQLPAMIFSVIVLLLSGYLFVSATTGRILNAAGNVMLVGPGYLIPDLSHFSIVRSFLTTNVLIAFPLIITLITSVYILRVSYQQSREPLKSVGLTIVPFMMLYYCLLSAFWFVAAAKETVGAKSKW